MFHSAKDAIVSKAAQVYVNRVIECYGRVEEFRIDSKRNRIEVTCQLIGEASSIGVIIEKYRVEQVGEKKFLQVLDSSATRPWLQAVIRDHLHGRRVEVPGWASSAL